MTDPVRDWRTDWDHADPAWAEDPFAIWTSLRQKCPVARTERYGGGWLITTHALIDHVTHDTATFSSRETGVRPPGTNTKKSPPITSDPAITAPAATVDATAFPSVPSPFNATSFRGRVQDRLPSQCCRQRDVCCV